VGCAYLAGALYGIAHHMGWQARDAERIVGTSAGSLVGALAASGVSAEDLAAVTRGIETTKALPDSILAATADNAAMNPSWVEMLTSLTPPTPLGLWQSARNWSIRPLLLSVLPHGQADLATLMSDIDTMNEQQWPATDLAVCAVDAATGKRRVLDRGSGVALSTAVAASCSVPGLFVPQIAGGRKLVDGGLHSMTNIDALDISDLDEVWVIAPMAGVVFAGPLTWGLRRLILRRLNYELQLVSERLPVRLFAPGREAAEAMGIDLMATDRADATVLAGFLEAGDQLTVAAAGHG
jgi:NTE family protein